MSFPDRNQLDPAAQDHPTKQVQYGRLRYIVEFELPAIPHAGTDFSQPKTYRLACIQPCSILNGEQLVEFSEMTGTPVFVQIGVVECSIGRVKTSDGWSIVDLLSGLALYSFPKT